MTPEDKEQLSYMVISDAYKSLLKLLDIMVEDINSHVIKCNVEEDDGKKLVRRKLRAEGAQKLQREVVLYLNRLKEAAEKSE